MKVAKLFNVLVAVGASSAVGAVVGCGGEESGEPSGTGGASSTGGASGSGGAAATGGGGGVNCTGACQPPDSLGWIYCNGNCCWLGQQMDPCCQ